MAIVINIKLVLVDYLKYFFRNMLGIKERLKEGRNAFFFKVYARVAFIISILILISPISLVDAQDKGSLSGRIFNSYNNEAIPFATLYIYGTNIASMSDLDGNFLFTGLTPGFVELRASSVGFEPYVSEPILVTNAKKVFIEIPMNEKPENIKEVVVKASQFRRVEESPVSLRRIDIQQIEKYPGGNRDISKVIQSLPGVASGLSFRNDVIVRGGGSGENRFYLDGIEIPNINHFATQGTSGGSVGIINVDFIREVNFYSGAFPVNKGNALSSIIDIRQTDGNKDKLRFKGSVGASDVAIALDGPINSSTNYIFSVRRSYLQFLFSRLGLPFLPTYNDMQFKIRHKLDDKNEISFIGLGALDHSELNLKANKTEEQRYILGYLPDYDQWNYTLGFLFRHFRETSNDTWVISRNMLGNQQYKYVNNDKNSGKKLLDYSSYETENKFRFEHNKQTSTGIKIISGIGSEYNRYHNSTYRILTNGDTVRYKTDMDLIKWSLFFQLTKKLLDNKLSFSLGMRADACNYSIYMQNILHQLSPGISFSYEFLPKWYFNSNVGIYHELPPYTTLGFRDNSGKLVNKINNLRYVAARHYVTGIEYQPNTDSKFTLEGFLKQYSDYMVSKKDSVVLANKGADYGTYGDEPVTSTGIGRAYGLELLYQNKSLKTINLTVSYTLVRSEYKSVTGKYIPSAWDSRHLINITALKSFKHNWDLGLKWRFSGGLPYTPDNYYISSLKEVWDISGKAVPDFSRYNTSRLKPFHQLDVRLDKGFYFNNWSLRVYLDIQNLYNTKSGTPPVLVRSEDSNGNPLLEQGSPVRYVLKELNTANQGTILPTTGIIIEF
jgi:outer membrane receptor for ferrienterochelin and colicin